MKHRCEVCGRVFHGRADATKCGNHRCRQRQRQMDAQIEVPEIPKSGVKGITYMRINKRWSIKIKLRNEWKYVGTKPTLSEAIRFQKEVMNG